MKQFRFSPTLLNDFTYLLEDAPFMTEGGFLEKVNRVEKPATEAMSKGINFERIIMDHSLDFEGFDKDIIRTMRTITKGSFWQVPINFTLTIDGNLVKIVGYMDALKANKGFDIKTGRQYEFLQFENKWQHRVYLVGMDKAGGRIEEFEYCCTDFKDVYREQYQYQPEKYLGEITLICGDLIDFLDRNRKRIFNDKVFGGNGNLRPDVSKS